MNLHHDIDHLLKHACEKQASDVHITVNSPPVLRINGRLLTEGEIPLTSDDTDLIAREIVGADNWDDFIKVGEIDLSYQLANGTRFRVNAYHQREQIGIAFRIIVNDIPSLTELNMPDIIQKMAEKSHGLFLVTGPTGSGKSTTLAAMIDYINKNEAKHIITLEDPIEYEHQHHKSIVNQREVGKDTNKFANGLRAALRQDPDVILVGEMRDHETISTAITAAETGHLVLATLHTSSAFQTINRIIDVFPSHQQPQIRTQLSLVLTGVLSQRLIPTADHSGRIAATEVLVNLPAVANLIRNKKIEQISNVMQTNRTSGMHTLETSINTLLGQGKISREQATPYLASAGAYE